MWRGRKWGEEKSGIVSNVRRGAEGEEKRGYKRTEENRSQKKRIK